MVLFQKRFPFYAVEGRGIFPEDMLRYDGSTPITEEEHKIALDVPEIPNAPPRRVRLITQYGFCPERWRSFGWIVIACAKTLEELNEELKEDVPGPKHYEAGKWIPL